jgi:hypothetical protein
VDENVVHFLRLSYLCFHHLAEKILLHRFLMAMDYNYVVQV